MKKSSDRRIESDLILEPATTTSPPDIEGQRRLRVNVYAGAPDGNKTRLGLIVFRDFTQTDISLEGTAAKMIVFTNDGAAYSKLSIDIHNVYRASKLWGLLIQNPFTRLEEAHGKISILPSDVLISNHLSVDAWGSDKNTARQ